MKRFLPIVVLLAFLAGCNTMAGAGRDMERAGEKVQDKATR